MKRPLGILPAVFALALPGFAYADSAAKAETARSTVAEVAKESPSVQTAVEGAKGARATAEQRLANGELLYRSKDYMRAQVVFSEILEEFPGTRSEPDALWLRGETYYESREFLSARRDYKRLVDNASDPRFNPYLGRALGRLVDVSLRTNDLTGLDDLFAKLNQVPSSQVDAGLNYAKGKAYYARKDFVSSAQAFQAVGPGTAYTHQARYFEALIVMRQAQLSSRKVATNGAVAAVDYKPAIEAFRRVTVLEGDSDDHKDVIDLSHLAIARLFYEAEQYAQAAEAYGKVGRDSKQFDTMLYELAWVYVRQGDVQRAERALEVLSIADPSSPVLGEGTLLRADLLLRSGSFRKALELYETVKGQYDPARVKVDTFLTSTTDLRVFYEKLSQQQLESLDQGELPPMAVQWAREAEDGPMAFAVIDDINQCKTLLKQSYQLVDKLNALVGASNRVRAFPELLAGEQKALGLLNRLTVARVALADGLDEEEGDVQGELRQVRDRRRELQKALAGIPTNAVEFDARDYDGTRQWNKVSQELSRQLLEIDQLQAVVNGLRRVLRDDVARGKARNPTDAARFQAELDTNERELKQKQKEITELRRQVEFGRAQVGLGDARYQADVKNRKEFREVLAREVSLAAAGQGGTGARNYAQRVSSTLTQADQEETRLVAAFDALETQVAAKVGELKEKIERERTLLTGYEQRLATLDGEAQTLVANVARRNFGFVRDKLNNMVLRADVGITEQAWEVREEEIFRVSELQTERARQESALDDELKEVLDDSGPTK